jgi:hypothetical protein
MILISWNNLASTNLLKKPKKQNLALNNDKKTTLSKTKGKLNKTKTMPTVNSVINWF